MTAMKPVNERVRTVLALRERLLACYQYFPGGQEEDRLEQELEQACRQLTDEDKRWIAQYDMDM